MWLPRKTDHSNMSQMSRLQGVDFFRVLAIVAVIAIHTQPFADGKLGDDVDASLVANQVARFAVPFFFILAGFFWGRKVEEARGDFRPTISTIKKLAIVFAAWSLIHLLPFNIVAALEHGPLGPIKSVYWNISGALNDPVDTLFRGTQYHLWFLPALISSVAIASVFVHYRKQSLLALTACLFFVIALLGSSYRTTPLGIAASFDFTYGPFFSLIFFVTGYFLHSRQQTRLWLPIGVTSAILGVLLHSLEVHWLNSTWQASLAPAYVLGTYFFGLGIALIALSNRAMFNVGMTSSVGPLVLGIYASHIIFVELLEPLDVLWRGEILWSVSYVGLVFYLSLLLARQLAKYPGTRMLVS